jgi:cardiolipin synthase
MSRHLIVLPDDSAWPILEAIAAAKRSLRVKMFLFSDPELLEAVISAHQRGVREASPYYRIIMARQAPR